MVVRVQDAGFDLGAEMSRLISGDTTIGAVVSFTGTVRDTGDLISMTLEHYPGMTEASLVAIETEAHQRWPLQASLIIHRYGRLVPGDNIVGVATASSHRQAAFDAAAFLMDYLKTEAPFWKREETAEGATWVDARETDSAARDRWQQS